MIVALQPISDLYSSVWVSNSFLISYLIRDSELCSTEKVKVSFDNVSLLTNVYLFRIPYRYIRMTFIDVTLFSPAILRFYSWNSRI